MKTGGKKNDSGDSWGIPHGHSKTMDTGKILQRVQAGKLVLERARE